MVGTILSYVAIILFFILFFSVPLLLLTGLVSLFTKNYRLPKFFLKILIYDAIGFAILFATTFITGRIGILDTDDIKIVEIYNNIIGR